MPEPKASRRAVRVAVRLVSAVSVAAVLAAWPAAARSAPRLLDQELRMPQLLVLGAAEEEQKPGSLDFDLLGAPKEAPKVDDEALRRRRTLLNWHQGIGLGMVALDLATTVVGQLNYSDKFGGDNTARYTRPHAILAYSTLATFLAAGTLSILAPKPFASESGFDRATLHKIAMATAAVGMLAQGVLGIWTSSREGYLNQQSIGTVHLVIGYATLAAILTGVGAMVL
jgi:hypothetical protein